METYMPIIMSCLMGKFTGYDGGAGDFQLGPLCFMLNYPDHCVLYRFTPRGITETDMEIVWYVRGDAEEGVDYDKEAETTEEVIESLTEAMDSVKERADRLGRKVRFAYNPFVCFGATVEEAKARAENEARALQCLEKRQLVLRDGA